MIHSTKIKLTPINILLVLAFLVVLAAFLADFINVMRSGSIDLRQRVAAVRHVQQGYDPYYTIKADSSGNVQFEARKVTVPPTWWVLLYPIAKMPYQAARYVWFILSWVFLITAVKLFANNSGPYDKAKWIWFVSLFFLVGGLACRLHMERGQIYIVYLLFLSGAFWYLRQKFDNGPFIGGIILGLLVSLRPTFGLMMIPALIYKKWKICVGCIAGIVVGVLLSLTVTGAPFLWHSYYDSQRKLTGFKDLKSTGGDRGLRYAYELEKMYPDMERYRILINPLHSVVDSSIKRVFNDKLSPRVLLIMFISILTFSTAGLIVHRQRSGMDASNSLVFLIGIWFAILSDHFIPYPLWSYYDVMWIAPISAIMICADSPSFFKRPSTIMGLLILVLGMGVCWVDYSLLISACLMLIYIPIVICEFLTIREMPKTNLTW